MSTSWHDRIIYEGTRESSHPFSQVRGSSPFLWGTLKIDFCSTTNHKSSTFTEVTVVRIVGGRGAVMVVGFTENKWQSNKSLSHTRDIGQSQDARWHHDILWHGLLNMTAIKAYWAYVFKWAKSVTNLIFKGLWLPLMSPNTAALDVKHKGSTWLIKHRPIMARQSHRPPLCINRKS